MLSIEKFTVKPGDIFRDRDPRMEGRHLKVVSAGSRHAYVVNCAADGSAGTDRKTRVSIGGLETRFERVGGSRLREDLERAVLSAAMDVAKVVDVSDLLNRGVYLGPEISSALAALRAAVEALEDEG